MQKSANENKACVRACKWLGRILQRCSSRNQGAGVGVEFSGSADDDSPAAGQSTNFVLQCYVQCEWREKNVNSGLRFLSKVYVYSVKQCINGFS